MDVEENRSEVVSNGCIESENRKMLKAMSSICGAELVAWLAVIM